MLQPVEQKVLEFLSSRQLVTIGELHALVEGETPELVLNRLKTHGFVESVPNMANTYIITKLGLRALKGE